MLIWEADLLVASGISTRAGEQFLQLSRMGLNEEKPQLCHNHLGPLTNRRYLDLIKQKHHCEDSSLYSQWNGPTSRVPSQSRSLPQRQQLPCSTVQREVRALDGWVSFLSFIRDEEKESKQISQGKMQLLELDDSGIDSWVYRMAGWLRNWLVSTGCLDGWIWRAEDEGCRVPLHRLGSESLRGCSRLACLFLQTGHRVANPLICPLGQ